MQQLLPVFRLDLARTRLQKSTLIMLNYLKLLHNFQFFLIMKEQLNHWLIHVTHEAIRGRENIHRHAASGQDVRWNSDETRTRFWRDADAIGGQDTTTTLRLLLLYPLGVGPCPIILCSLCKAEPTWEYIVLSNYITIPYIILFLSAEMFSYKVLPFHGNNKWVILHQ